MFFLVGNLVEEFIDQLFSLKTFYNSNMLLEHLYAYSLNETLLDLPLDEIEKIPGIKVQYLQVDSKSECVPKRWFMGSDAFPIYTFINLIGYGPTSLGGYMKPVFTIFQNEFKVDFTNGF